MLISDLKTYQGPALEEGGTSIGGGVVPAVRKMFMDDDITPDMKVIDFGAGKSGRNAKWLRDRGVQVYAYDPHHGTDCDGWEGVSNVLPTDKCDVLFSSYVMNVVPENIEDDILKQCDGLADRYFHVTRNKDITDMIRKALARGDQTVSQFYKDEYGGPEDPSDEELGAFATFGTKTSKGFQRIPHLEHKGFNLDKSTSGYKVYSR